MSMYITHQDGEGTLLNAHPPVKSPQIVPNSNPSHCHVRLHQLQNFISATFNNCSLPPINQFLDLDIQESEHGESVSIKLKNYTNSSLLKIANSKQTNEQYVYYVYSGKVNLQCDLVNELIEEDAESELNQLRRTYLSKSAASSQLGETHVPQAAEKLMQVKENNFFVLSTVANKGKRCSMRRQAEGEDSQLQSIEKLRIHSYEKGEYGRCLVGKIRINPKYGLEWYKGQSRKYQFISAVFNRENGDISEHKLKGLARFFQHEQFRRGTFLIREDQSNSRLFILSSGECQYTKNYAYSEKNHSITKTIRVANAGPNTLIGSQFLLYQFSGHSKPASVIAKALQSTFSDISKSSKITLQINHSSRCNFTVSILSAFSEVYWITVSKFKQLCQKYIEEAPSILRKNVQNGYVTILRNLKEKISLQQVKLGHNQTQKSEKRVLFEARVQSGQYKERTSGQKNINEPETQIQILEQHQQLSPTKYGTFNRSQLFEGPKSALFNTYTSEMHQSQHRKSAPHIQISKAQLKPADLQNGQIQNARTQRLQKKIDLIMSEKKPSINFKKKIEGLMLDKFMSNRKNDNKSPILALSGPEPQAQRAPIRQDEFQKPQAGSPEGKKLIMADLEQIFMNKDDGGRTMSIQRQNQILMKKEQLLKKRYSSTDNILIVNQESHDTTKNKLYRMDLIRKGALELDKNLRESIRVKRNTLNMGAYSNRVKNNCIEKINKANKIKEQFMTIKSECEHCHCYDNIEGIYESTTQKDPKSQTMKTGSAWRLSESRNNSSPTDEPLYQIHYRTKFVSEKSASKYSHNKHLASKRKGMMPTSQRRLSAPAV